MEYMLVIYVPAYELKVPRFRNIVEVHMLKGEKDSSNLLIKRLKRFLERAHITRLDPELKKNYVVAVHNNKICGISIYLNNTLERVEVLRRKPYIGEGIGSFLTYLAIKDTWDGSDDDIKSTAITEYGLKMSLLLGAIPILGENKFGDYGTRLDLIYSKGAQNQFWICYFDKKILANLGDADGCVEITLKEGQEKYGEKLYLIYKKNKIRNVSGAAVESGPKTPDSLFEDSEIKLVKLK